MGIWNRHVKVVLKTSDGKQTVIDSDTWDGLNVKFDVTLRAACENANEAKISILGMTPPKIQYVTSYMDFTTEILKHKTISLYAGYKEMNNTTLLFNGDVVHALPTMPPDVWLEIDAKAGHYRQMEKISKSTTKEMSFQQLCDFAAKWIGVSLDWKVKDGNIASHVVKGYEYTGSIEKCMEALAQIQPVYVYLSHDNKSIVVVDRDNPDAGLSMKQINKNTGLIGIPQPSVIGCEFDCFMDPTIMRFQPMMVQSEMIPSMNGIYLAYEVKHSGDLRGGRWISHVKCRRPDEYNR